MSKLEATAYNYGAKIKGGAMSEIVKLGQALHQATEAYKEVRAENDRLIEALEKVAELDWTHDPHEARRIAKAALAPGSGESLKEL